MTALLTLFQTPAGCRIIINTYVQFAVDTAIILNNLGHMAVFPEIAVSHPHIPSIGRVTGIVDHLVAKSGNRDPYYDGDIISAMEPVLAIIEAKKSDTVGQKGLVSQLIAQLLGIQHKEYEFRYYHIFLLNIDNISHERRLPVGLLTDGEVLENLLSTTIQ